MRLTTLARLWLFLLVSQIFWGGCRRMYFFETVKFIVLPEGLSTLKHRTFYNCIRLNSIVIPNSVILIKSGVFHNCKQPSYITIPPSITSI